MRFLCISFLSPPGTDAESACTGRFLSALVNAGHEVKLISLDHAQAERRLDPEVEAELLDRRISVVRIPLRKSSNLCRHMAQIRHGLIDICAEYISDAVRQVKEDLRSHPDTILISRSAWPASNLVGWKCRKYAKMWIPHFSDPFPSYKKMGFKAYWKYPFSYFWLIRILRDSTFVTVTCHNAIRYFDEITARRFHDKFHIAFHIGFPRLRTSGYYLPKKACDQKVIVHVGELFPGRPVGRFSEFCHRFPNLRFVQFGVVHDEKIKEKVEVHTISSPRMATDAMAEADAILVCDLDSGFGYTPYLPSKFAYAFALQRPIICLTTPDSEMAAFAKKHDGVYFINMFNPCDDRAEELLGRLADGRLVAPSPNDDCEFLPSQVAAKFIARITSL